MTTRMTVQRLVRLIAAGDVDDVRTAVAENPRLLARGVEREGQGGWTPLHSAAENADLESIKALRAVGADPEAVNDEGRTPADLTTDPDVLAALRAD